MTISTAGVEKGHAHSRQVGVLGTVQPFWSQLLAVLRGRTQTNPKGNSTARDPPTLGPEAPKGGYTKHYL